MTFTGVVLRMDGRKVSVVVSAQGFRARGIDRL
uniref:Uncharacterized protein n=1 Tax=Ralstonia solanacearum TaxID=305 RepID=A0A0S4UCT8_RALSL|nr:protein of unknown function [Ralstonia solanacearum]CUV28243.1 protein of unknown function [Ralstonia solanacearum]